MSTNVALGRHYWLLDVCDDLLDYCDRHDLDNTADRLRYVLIAILKDAERAALNTSQPN